MNSAGSLITVCSNPFESGGIDSRIHEVIKDCISAIPKDSECTIAVYMIHDKSIKGVKCDPKSLVELLKEKSSSGGRNIRLFFDVEYQKSFEEIEKVKMRFGTKMKVFTRKGKQPGRKGAGFRKNWTDMKVHVKTFCFSSLNFDNGLPKSKSLKDISGKIEYVVIQTSANLWVSQYSQANQMVIIYGNKELYEHTLSNLDYLIQKKKRGSADYESECGKIKSFFLPRREEGEEEEKKKENLVNQILSKMEKNLIQLKGGEERRPYLRIAMSGFTDEQVAKKLVMMAEFCDVKIIIRKERINDRSIQYLKKGYKHEGFECYEIYNKDPKIKLHSKFFLYDGMFKFGENDVKYSRIVWSGSMQFTKSGLYSNGESLIRIIDDVHFNYIEKEWNKLYKYAKNLKS